jgi:hypothetical protein
MTPGAGPLLITGELGEGRVALVNASADADWGSLAAKPAFIPFIQRLVVWLLEPKSRCQNLLPGQPYRLSLPLSAINATVKITLPSVGGAKAKTVTIQPVREGSRAVCHFTATDWAGFYQVEWADGAPGGPSGREGSREGSRDGGNEGSRRLFAVNIDPVESDLATIEPEGLKELAAGGSVRWVSVVGKEGKLQSVRDEVQLWWPFLAAVLVILMVETWLGRRFSGGRTKTGARG